MQTHHLAKRAEERYDGEVSFSKNQLKKLRNAKKFFLKYGYNTRIYAIEHKDFFVIAHLDMRGNPVTVLPVVEEYVQLIREAIKKEHAARLKHIEEIQQGMAKDWKRLEETLRFEGNQENE